MDHGWTPRSLRSIDGLLVQAYERGSRTDPTVVLVHGYPDDHAVWDLVADDLAADHHVVAYDVRGAGRSGQPASVAGFRLTHLLDDLDAVATAVSPDAPVHLVGHDWGSMQGWAAVLDPTRRDRFASFTSLGGPPLAHVARWVAARRAEGAAGAGRLARQALASWYIAAFQTPLAPAAWRRVVAPRWRKSHAAGPDRVDARWPSAQVADDAVLGLGLYRANLGPGARRHGHSPVAAEPTSVPVRLLVALDDPFVTPSLLDGVEELAPGLVRTELTGGHWLPRSRPATVAAEVRAQVAGATAATPVSS